MFKRLLAVLVVIMLTASVMAGCGKKDNSTNPSSSSGAAVSETGKDSINIVVGGEPLTIDPSINSSVDGGIYILHAFEGLTKVDKDGNTVKGVAESWDITEGGKKYTFHLKADAKWSDGQPVKASDFEFSWKRALAPETASEYAYQLWYLKNGEKYSSGTAKAEDVGVKAINDSTLEVTLEAPTPYFIDLMHFPTYMPLRKDIIDANGDQWTQKPETYIGNGAYKMKSWEHKSQLTFVKNDQYYAKDDIKLKTINWKLLEDDTTTLSGYENGELDVVDGLIPQAETLNLINSGKAKVYDMVGTYYVYFNCDREPLKDPKVRRALALAIDRKYIVEKITSAGQKPAAAVVPFKVPGLDPAKDFRGEGEAMLPETANVDEARKLLAEAGYPDGKGFPEVEILYNTQSGHKAIMESVQQQWKTNLGITVKNPTMEWAVLQDMVNTKNYTMARMGWIGDYNDPMTFLDMWTSNSSQNNTNWKNSEFDAQIAAAKATDDQTIRMEAMHKAEKIFIDDMPAMPVYYYVSVFLQTEKLKDMNVDTLGFTYLHFAYFDK